MKAADQKIEFLLSKVRSVEIVFFGDKLLSIKVNTEFPLTTRREPGGILLGANPISKRGLRFSSSNIIS